LKSKDGALMSKRAQRKLSLVKEQIFVSDSRSSEEKCDQKMRWRGF
jgi:hypothetical protein